MASPSPDRGAGTSLFRGIGTVEQQGCSIIVRDGSVPCWFSAKLFPRYRGKSSSPRAVCVFVLLPARARDLTA